MNSKNLVREQKSQAPTKPILNIVNRQCFDYGILDQETQISVRQKTCEIKGLIRQTAQDIFKVGQKLAEVKQQLKHGQFRNWLKTEFNWSVSSATKFMQVSEQFKNVNFTHFNFATSALYVLAAPSTPEAAREHALKLASRGENITYSLAKLIVKHHKESVDINVYPSGSQKELTQLKPLDDGEAALIINNDSQNKVVEKLDDKSVRIVGIKQDQPKCIEDRIQDFEIIYAGTCVAVEGRPNDLTILFKKMQENPQFAEDIFRQAKSLSE